MTKKIESITLFNIIACISHSAKIKRGHLYELVIYEFLVNQYQNNPDVEVQKNIQIDVPIDIVTGGKHQMDIIIIDHNKKTIILLDPKSDGISNTDRHDRIVLPPMRASKSTLQLAYPDYNIRMVVCRPSGQKIEIWEKYGLETVKSSDFVGGQNINKLAQKRFHEIIKRTAEEMIEKYKINEKHKTFIRAFVQMSFEEANSEYFQELKLRDQYIGF